MPNTISDNYIVQFNNALDIISRNVTSKLLPTVTVDSMGAEYKYYDRLGQATVAKKTGHLTDTIWQDPQHSRRRLEPEHYIDHLPIDHIDKLMMAISPESDYGRVLVQGMNKEIDKSIAKAATATVFTGKTGSTPVAFPTSQTIAVNYVESGTPTNSNLTIGKLRRARFLLEEAEVIAPGEELFFIMSASQQISLLKTTEVTSSDYNVVRSLVNGEVSTFMGFTFVVSQQLEKTGNIRKCLAYPKSALKFAWLDPVKGKIAERPDKNYAIQVSIMASWGAIRMWEEKVVAINCDETL